MPKNRLSPNVISCIQQRAIKLKLRRTMRWVLINLLHDTDARGIYQASNETLADATGLSVRTVRLALGELEDLNFLRRERAGPGKAFGPITLILEPFAERCP